MQKDHSDHLDRSNSILTTSQRKSLANTEHDHDHGEDLTPKARQRIRERTLSGTKDLGILYQYLDERDIKQTFESDSTEEIMDAMRFFLRVCGTLDEPIEEPLEEAIFDMVSEKHPQKVVSNVSIQIETADREKAARRGKEKINQRGKVSLSPIEIQAVAETDYRQLSPLTVPQSETELKMLILDNLSVIDDTLELIDRKPGDTALGVTPDAVARNGHDQLVVIEFKRNGEQKSAIDQLKRYVEEYGGSENVEGILVALDDPQESQPVIRTYRYQKSETETSQVPLDEFLDNANPM